MNKTPKCEECKYCKNFGKATFGYSTTNRTFNRSCYYCVCDDLNAFIGHGKCTPNSPVMIKTSPRWCPLKEKMKNDKC